MKVHAIIVTYRRADAVRTTMTALLRQSRPPDTIWLIDNAPTETLRNAATEWANTQYVAMPTNIGPAGAIAHGMTSVLADADDDDWIVLIDDDDPPQFDDAIARLLTVADIVAPGLVAGIGVVGSRFDRRRAGLQRLADSELGAGPIDVDYIGGGHLPLYRVAAIRAVGVVDTTFFFGFEDLEFGLRLRARGWRVVADSDQWLELRQVQGRLARAAIDRHTVRIATSPWRRYYSTRNLIECAWRYGRRRSVAAAVLRSGIGGAAMSLVRDRSLRAAVFNLRGAIDGVRRVGGARVQPS